MLGDLSESGMEATRHLIVEAYPDAAVTTRFLDVSDEKIVEEFYSFATSHFGSIDYAANVAGVSQAATPIHLTPDGSFDKMYAVNQKGVSTTMGSGRASRINDIGISV